MTKLTTRVIRESDRTIFDQGKTRPVVITLHPNGVIELSLKGRSAICSRVSVRCDALYMALLRRHLPA